MEANEWDRRGGFHSAPRLQNIIAEIKINRAIRRRRRRRRVDKLVCTGSTKRTDSRADK